MSPPVPRWRVRRGGALLVAELLAVAVLAGLLALAVWAAGGWDALMRPAAPPDPIGVWR